MEALDLRRLLLSEEIKELHSEYQSSVWWNIWRRALSTISHFSGDGQSCFSSLVKLADSLIPALDNLTNTNLALEWLTSVNGGIEDGSVLKSSVVVDLDLSSGWADWPSSFVKLFNFEFRHLYL